MEKPIVITAGVRDVLQAELAAIQDVRLPAAQRALASSSSEVDPDDRADEDLEQQAEQLRKREAELRNVLATADIIDSNGGEVVAIGSTVTVRDGRSDQTYTIVGTVGADPERGWITTESPLGAALLGHRQGDTVQLHSPEGPRSVTIHSLG
jgi:transcription elongation factor GreA